MNEELGLCLVFRDNNGKDSSNGNKAKSMLNYLANVATDIMKDIQVQIDEGVLPLIRR